MIRAWTGWAEGTARLPPSDDVKSQPVIHSILHSNYLPGHNHRIPPAFPVISSRRTPKAQTGFPNLGSCCHSAPELLCHLLSPFLQLHTGCSPNTGKAVSRAAAQPVSAPSPAAVSPLRAISSSRDILPAILPAGRQRALSQMPVTHLGDVTSTAAGSTGAIPPTPLAELQRGAGLWLLFPIPGFLEAKFLMSVWCWAHSPHLLSLCRMPADRQKVRAPGWLTSTLPWSSGQLTAPWLSTLGPRWANYCRMGNDHVKRMVKCWAEPCFSVRWSRKGRKGSPSGLRGVNLLLQGCSCCKVRGCNQTQSGQAGLPSKCLWAYLPAKVNSKFPLISWELGFSINARLLDLCAIMQYL